MFLCKRSLINQLCHRTFDYLLRILLCFLLCLFAACGRTSSDSKAIDKNKKVAEEVVDFDLDKIMVRGLLKVIIENSSTSYFIYKGQPMGYDYELLRRYARSIGVRLQFIISQDLEESFRKLNSGEGDILAYNLTVTKERKERIAFTHYHNLVRLVLIQRKPENWYQMKLHEIEDQLLTNPVDLIGKEVVVRKGSSYISRLENLSDEIGGDIVLVPAFAEQTTENLIHEVATGKIQYTVAEENVALLNATYFPILDVSTAISLPQQIAWGLRKNASQLQTSLNLWIDDMRKTADYNVIYNRYFKNTKTYTLLAQSDFSNLNSNTISPYDEQIKAASHELGWDWKLLAAMVFKESQFKPKAKSWAGAVGLMQLVPDTGELYGAKDLTDPTQNIDAGVKYLLWLDKLWTKRIPDKKERIKFVLASYNVGQGHVIDAVKLTEKYHGDAAKWNDVSEYLLKKSEPNYFNDPVVEFGYCRGAEPVNYVADILSLFDQYSQMISV
jgi:membrane-bound lytic murein transglycosylase F